MALEIKDQIVHSAATDAARVVSAYLSIAHAFFGINSLPSMPDDS